MRMLELQIAEIDCEADAFARVKRAGDLIDGSLRAEANGVVAKDTEHRGAKKNLMGLRLRNGDIVLEKTVGVFADEFGKEAPVPMIRRTAPFRRTVTVHEAIVENIRPLCAGMFHEFCECAAEPNIVAARSQTGNGAEHEAGSVRRDDAMNGGLRARYDETGKHRGFDASADFRCAVLEAPLRCDVEVAAGLDSRRRKLRIAENGGRGDEQREMRRETVTDESAQRSLLAEIVGTPKDSSVEAPFAGGICRRSKAKDGAVTIGESERRKTKITEQQKQ